jgi:hypothetical protein
VIPLRERGSVKIRLSGTEDEIAEMIEAVASVVEIRETSGFYLNRGSSVIGRVYLDAVPRRSVIHADSERDDKPKRRKLPPGNKK